MNVGDLVIVNVPPVGEKRWPACQGIIVEMRADTPGTGERRLRSWCYVLRGDTGKVEKFWAAWLQAMGD